MSKQVNCTVKGCINEGRYCRLHQSFTIKAEKPIAKESEKGKDNRKAYTKKCQQFKKDNPNCQAKIEGVCTGKTNHVHHMKGKVNTEDLLNEKHWLAVCAPCHRVIEQNPAFARQNGFSISRLAKTDKAA